MRINKLLRYADIDIEELELMSKEIDEEAERISKVFSKIDLSVSDIYHMLEFGNVSGKDMLVLGINLRNIMLERKEAENRHQENALYRRILDQITKPVKKLMASETKVLDKRELSNDNKKVMEKDFNILNSI